MTSSRDGASRVVMTPERIEREFRPSTDDVGHAVGLPPYCYTSEEFFEFEQEAVFSHDWLCLGRQEEIPESGDYFTLQVNDDPLVVVRGEDGLIRAMSNVCRHRAAIVARGSGNCSPAFRCHYHWWTYGLDGRLISAPEMDRTPDFDIGEVALPQLKVEIWKGFIFGNFDHDAEALAPQLTNLDALLTNYHLDEMVTMPPQVVESVPCNWKVMAENFIESYHSSRLHQGPLDFAPSSATRFDPEMLADPAAIYGWTATTHPDAGFNPTMKAVFPPIETLTPEERQRVTFALVPPLLMLGVNCDHMVWSLGLPAGPNEIALRMARCFPPSTYKHPEFELLYAMALRGAEVFDREDLLANAGVQAGLRSRFAPRGRYAHQEARLPQFNRWLVRRYEAAATPGRAPTR
jgi:phenylpropionate dioxygenase-like ring-hydroxylating dioxygenase large terminal subunit